MFPGMLLVNTEFVAHIMDLSRGHVHTDHSEWLIANEPAERRRSAGEAAENSAARRIA